MGRLSNAVGTILVLLVIFISAPFFIPAMFGLQSFCVLTSSMEPAYPKNSVVYVKEVNPKELKPGDTITFRKNADSAEVVTHRVVENDTKNQALQTKGDANRAEDAGSVSYKRVVGQVAFTIPYIGFFALFAQSTVGKLCELAILAAGAILWYIGSLIKKKGEGKCAEKKEK